MQKIILLMLQIIMLSSCASHDLQAPCADYGKWCSKIPVNTWNYNTDDEAPFDQLPGE